LRPTRLFLPVAVGRLGPCPFSPGAALAIRAIALAVNHRLTTTNPSTLTCGNDTHTRTQTQAAAAAALVAAASTASASAATNTTNTTATTTPDPTTAPPIPPSFTFLPSYSGDPASYAQWRPMSCSTDGAHSYCFPRCAPRGGARPRCAGGPAWRLDEQTGLCFRLTGEAAEAAVKAALKQTGEMEVKLRAWTDDPLEPGEATRSPPSCPPGSSPWPPATPPAGLLGAAGAEAAATSAPDPKLCLMCQPGDTLDVTGNRPRCLKPCPGGYDAVTVGGREEEQGQEDGAAPLPPPHLRPQGAPFCVQRCRPQDGYPYGRYCVSYGDFEYPGDCGWMSFCEEGYVLLQHGKGGAGAAAAAAAEEEEEEGEQEADLWGDLLGGDSDSDSSKAAAPATTTTTSADDPLGLASSKPPLSHMWAADGVNDESVGLGDGYGGPSRGYPFGAAARLADRALLRRRRQQRLHEQQRRRRLQQEQPRPQPYPPRPRRHHGSPGTPLSALSSDPLAPFLDQFDRRYVQSPLYDPAAQCRCARAATDRAVRPRTQYLPLVRLPEPEVQTALPRCSEVRVGMSSETARSDEAGQQQDLVGACVYDRARGACACACPAGWRGAGGGDGGGESGGVCCDPSCPEGFRPCEAGGRRFCAASKPLLGADSCDVLSRLLPFLSPSAVCGASAPDESAAAPAGFSARAVASTASSWEDDDGDGDDGQGAKAGAKAAAEPGYPGAMFAGITSLPDVFSDEDRRRMARLGGGNGGGGVREEAADDLSASLLAQALEKQYQVSTNAPPPPMTVHEVLSMDPWASEFGGGQEEASPSAARKKQGGKEEEQQKTGGGGGAAADAKEKAASPSV
jgi:hypothetical protein